MITHRVCCTPVFHSFAASRHLCLILAAEHLYCLASYSSSLAWRYICGSWESMYVVWCGVCDFIRLLGGWGLAHLESVLMWRFVAAVGIRWAGWFILHHLPFLYWRHSRNKINCHLGKLAGRGGEYFKRIHPIAAFVTLIRHHHYIQYLHAILSCTLALGGCTLAQMRHGEWGYSAPNRLIWIKFLWKEYCRSN